MASFLVTYIVPITLSLVLFDVIGVVLFGLFLSAVTGFISVWQWGWFCPIPPLGYGLFSIKLTSYHNKTI